MPPAFHAMAQRRGPKGGKTTTTTGGPINKKALIRDEEEAAAGDPDAAQRRSALLEDLPLVEIDSDVTSLAEELIEKLPLPRRAGADALHIAAATCAGVDFLLTWNCAHIANAELRPGIEKVCREQGYAAPVLCTPDEFMGEAGDD